LAMPSGAAKAVSKCCSSSWAVCLFMTAFLPQHGASFICETVFQPSVTSYSAHLLWPSAGF
jgi:hypothetical protein